MLESVFNKIAGDRPTNLLKRDSNTGFFPVKIPACSRAPILQNIIRKIKNICQRLLLVFQKQNMHIQ